MGNSLSFDRATVETEAYKSKSASKLDLRRAASHDEGSFTIHEYVHNIINCPRIPILLSLFDREDVGDQDDGLFF